MVRKLFRSSQILRPKYCAFSSPIIIEMPVSLLVLLQVKVFITTMGQGIRHVGWGTAPDANPDEEGEFYGFPCTARTFLTGPSALSNSPPRLLGIVPSIIHYGKIKNLVELISQENLSFIFLLFRSLFLLYLVIMLL